MLWINSPNVSMHKFVPYNKFHFCSLTVSFFLTLDNLTLCSVPLIVLVCISVVFLQFVGSLVFVSHIARWSVSARFIAFNVRLNHMNQTANKRNGKNLKLQVCKEENDNNNGIGYVMQCLCCSASYVHCICYVSIWELVLVAYVFCTYPSHTHEYMLGCMWCVYATGSKACQILRRKMLNN